MQRVAIARAISIRPKFIMADEVTSMLDASLRLGIIDLMLDLQREFETSYLFITHDLAIARYFTLKGGGEMGVMYLGKIVELAETEELFTHPLHPYTEALLSAVPVPDPDYEAERIILQGDVPSPVNPPSGCYFHPRCPYAQPICAEQPPEFRDYGDHHYAACHFANQLSLKGVKMQ